MPKFPEMNWTVGDVAEEFQLFKQRMELCFIDQNIVEPIKRAVKIKIAVGNEGLKKINASGLSTADQDDPPKLWSLFEDQLKIKVNFRIHRLELMRYKQGKEESLDDFVNRCRQKAAECDFNQTEIAERIIELVIASTPFEAFQKDLLDTPKGYTVENVLKEGRKYEAVVASRKSLSILESQDSGKSVNAIKTTKRKCGNCALSHPPRQCPAYYDKCKACGAKGHWGKCCRKTKGNTNFSDREHKQREKHDKYHRKPDKRPTKTKREQTNIHTVESDETDSFQSDDDNFTTQFDSITISTLNFQPVNRKEAYTNIDVICPHLRGKHKLKLKVDTGAEGNTLPVRTVRQMYPNDEWKNIIEPSRATLKAYNQTRIPCLGAITLTCKYVDSKWAKQFFYIVDVPGPAIVGLPTCDSLNIVTIHAANMSLEQQGATSDNMPTIRSIQDLTTRYPDQFDTIGNFKMEATLHLKEDAQPSIDPPRKYSIHFKDKLEAELNKMEDQGVIRKVTHHTDWCNSLSVVFKKDGTLRICLDPRRLNDNLKRCPHKTPKLEELNPAFSSAKYFSKLDAKAGYWSVPLAQESQELTTFRTPFGRYCFQRLPFGLSVSQDIFQQQMDNILQQTPGCVGIADDVVVYGQTEKEHNENLIRLFEVAKKEGLVFNSAKCMINTSQISFFGSMYSDKGISPDPSRINDIHRMPTPQDKEDLQRFLGAMNFLSPYIPNFSEKAAPLRELLKKNTPFLWQEDHQAAFTAIKQTISAESCLQYYNPNLPTIVEVDASQKGLGACLLQNNRPVAFASKSLSPAEANYSNIERETLALVYGIIRFHTYLFGKDFKVHTDHKPLEYILKKPLANAPPRLQRLLIKVQGYKFDVIYKPGSTMILSDTLSRLPNTQKCEEVPIDLHVEELYLSEKDESIQVEMDLINFGTNKQEALRRETDRDPTLRALMQVINEGWPDTIKELTQDLRPYWSFREQMGISDGVIFKGRQVIIPKPLQSGILSQLHTGHLGLRRLVASQENQSTGLTLTEK